MSLPVVILPTSTIQFATSLIDIAGRAAVTSNSDCTELTINDTSNYVNNTEDGHAPADFASFRRILIEYYKGGTINLSSIGDGDVIIPPASSGINQFVQPITTGDGRYDITLRAVPDWDGFDSYQAGDDCVFIPGASLPTSGVFYQALTNNVGQNPATSPSDWKVITEDQLPVKYNTKLFVATDCALLNCLNEKVDCAICKMSDAFCDDNMLCNNKCFLDAAKLQMIYYGIQIDVQNQNENGVDTKFDMVSKICGCSPNEC